MKPETTQGTAQWLHGSVIGASLLLCLWSLTLILSGCAIGPNYRRPAVTAPAQFRSAPETNSTASLADMPWWAMFKDQTLTNLIQTALTNNYDIRIAMHRVEQSYALAVQTRSQFFPQIGYDGNAASGKNSLFGSPSPLGLAGRTGPGDSFLALFNASWEVDLWGRIRRLDESARAQYLASEEARRGLKLSLIGQVAQAYFELLEMDEQLKIALRATNSYGESLGVFSHRLGAGAASELETSRAESALATAAAAVPDIERQIALKENQISVLLGRNPGPIARSNTLLQQVMPPEVPVGLPSELLERRPDILQAEQLARSANAQIGGGGHRSANQTPRSAAPVPHHRLSLGPHPVRTGGISPGTFHAPRLPTRIDHGYRHDRTRTSFLFLLEEPVEPAPRVALCTTAYGEVPLVSN